MSEDERAALETLRQAGYSAKFGFGVYILSIARDAFDAHVQFELDLARLEHQSAEMQKEHECTR